MVRIAWNLGWGGTKKYQVPGTVPSGKPPKVNRTEPYHAVPCSGKAPLESAPERILTLKFTLLLALTSLKRVGDLQALSVSEICMDFAPGLVKVTLRPRPGYIPKVLSTSFHSQVVTLHSFHPPPFASSEDEETSHALPGSGFEAVCGSLQGLEKILPVTGVFWCWGTRLHVQLHPVLQNQIKDLSR